MEQGRRWPLLDVRATGREPHGKMNVNRFGLPVGALMARKSVRGVRKGDIVKATASSGKRQGVRVPRVTVQAFRSFNILAPGGTVHGISHRHCRIVRRGDVYDTLR